MESKNRNRVNTNVCVLQYNKPPKRLIDLAKKDRFKIK
jgi:hypothetical protein